MNQPNRHRRRRRATPLPLMFAATPMAAALLLGVPIAIIGGGGGVRALPPNNGRRGVNSNTLHSLSGRRRNDGDGNGGGAGSGGGRSAPRGSAALHDAFPCESDRAAAAPSHSDRSTDRGGGDAAASDRPASASASASASSSDHLRGNSFAALNDLEAPKSNASSSSAAAAADAPRGGATVDALPPGELDDDEIDRMVESLIASVDDEEEGGDEGCEEGGVEEADESDDGGDYESEAEDGTEERESDYGVDEGESDNEEDETEEQDEEELAETPSSSEPIRKQQADPSPDQSNTRQLEDRPIPDKSSPLVIPPGTPTNAYYRFLVRRGPKGHVLAAFSIVAVQWIYVYLPFLYNAIAAILLKLRVYNPKVLYERDYQRQYRKRYGPPPKKKGLASKFFGSTSPKGSKKARAAAVARRQKADDVEAAAKLKQLYKTLKSGTSAMSEVKYRYLSVAFRERHGLGREYRAEGPRSFMGEVVADGRGRGPGGGEEVDAGEIVFSDAEDDAEERAGGSSEAAGKARGEGPGKSSSEQRRRPKRRRIDDWVVKAFVPSSVDGGGKGKSSSRSLWNSVERTAILQAAWESRAAERSASRGKRGAGPASKGGGGSNQDGDDEDEEKPAAGNAGGSGPSSSRGASKMIQSMMTRVGSNGRIFGAYPNDAPPIQLCAHREGVVELARRYGYGDWTRSSEEEFGADGLEEEVSEDGDDSWGGGDLIFDELEGSDEGVAASLDEDSTNSWRKKRTRRASKRRSGRRRRRRKKSSKN